MKGVNCGVLLVRDDARGRALLAHWWGLLDAHPGDARYAVSFPREQHVFNARLMANASHDGLVHVAPATDLYGWPLHAQRHSARLTFHNTKGNEACGRQRHPNPHLAASRREN